MSELKISDLSVGDWVRIKILPVPRKILSIDGRNGVLNFEREKKTASIEKIKPVPITPEILEANGMKFIEMDEEDGYTLYGNESVTVCAKHSSGLYSVALPLFSGAVRFVHQFQHALRLAGIDKEIEL